MKKIAILTGGTSSEREISLRSARHVETLLRPSFDVTSFDLPRDLDRFLTDRRTFALAIPLIHGRGGEDGTIQGFLKTLGLPFLFSDPEAHGLALDKEKAKTVLVAAGIRCPRAILTDGTVPIAYDHPVVVKPVDGGSSVATRLVRSQEELNQAVREAQTHSRSIMVEDAIDGQEFTVAVVDVHRHLRALPVILIRPTGGFFDFDSKYRQASLAEEICPAPIPDPLAAALQEIALTAHRVLGCRQVSRTDIIVDRGGLPWVLETNTIPGMTETSLLPKALRAAQTDLGRQLGEWIAET